MANVKQIPAKTEIPQPTESNPDAVYEVGFIHQPDSLPPCERKQKRVVNKKILINSVTQ
jgi:hypothetical protein